MAINGAIGNACTRSANDSYDDTGQRSQCVEDLPSEKISRKRAPKFKHLFDGCGRRYGPKANLWWMRLVIEKFPSDPRTVYGAKTRSDDGNAYSDVRTEDGPDGGTRPKAAIDEKVMTYKIALNHLRTS